MITGMEKKVIKKDSPPEMKILSMKLNETAQR
jgi:hypothetical protein